MIANVYYLCVATPQIITMSRMVIVRLLINDANNDLGIVIHRNTNNTDTDNGHTK